MENVAIYVRSSKDLHNVSCKAQETEITKKLKPGEEVYRVFSDEALSSINDVRPQFDELIMLATSKTPPFSKIYCLDTSRFGRDQAQTQTILWELRRKHGIEVDFINLPHTGTYLDPAFETIMSAFDYIHSQQSKAKGVASMKQNILNGHRAGGRPPYGYRLKYIDTGIIREGKPVLKSKLEPNPETAQIISEYFERRTRFESRGSILRDFHRRGIPSPSGCVYWRQSTVAAIENNLDTYLGHTVFNRHNERVKVGGKLDGYVGRQKWKPEEEWVRCNNTHEPLITPERADKIRQMKKRKVRETPSRAKRIYALSGLMACGECGSNYTGDRGIYRCNFYNKQGLKCHNNGISQRRVEGVLFSHLEKQVLNFKNIKDVIGRVKRRIEGNKPDNIVPIKKRLTELDKENERMLFLYRRGKIAPYLLEQEMEAIQKQKSELTEELQRAKESIKTLDVDAKVIKETIENFTKEVQNADPQIRKRTLMALIERVVIFPKKNGKEGRFLEVRGSCLPLTRVSMASPTRFELVSPA